MSIFNLGCSCSCLVQQCYGHQVHWNNKKSTPRKILSCGQFLLPSKYLVSHHVCWFKPLTAYWSDPHLHWWEPSTFLEWCFKIFLGRSHNSSCLVLVFGWWNYTKQKAKNSSTISSESQMLPGFSASTSNSRGRQASDPPQRVKAHDLPWKKWGLNQQSTGT